MFLLFVFCLLFLEKEYKEKGVVVVVGIKIQIRTTKCR